MNKDYFGIFMNCTLKHWSKVRVHCTGCPQQIGFMPYQL